MENTIVAISTALGTGAISIVRVTGPEAICIVNKYFQEKNLLEQKSHTIHYGHIVDNNEIIDEVLVMLMKGPKTYTTEDTVEINCHGGIQTTDRVLELLLQNGCTLAEPGEFTKRAYLNGRIDLNQAEGVQDLINAKTEEMRKMALNSVQGKVSKLIDDLRQKIVQVIANIEVNIDYPEYEDVEQVTIESIKILMKEVQEEIEHILNESKNGLLLKEGLKVAIIGKPNVGKSSLLNSLLAEEKAIVTDIAGTTRDIVEGIIQFDGILLHIIDTAGIRDTENIVEKLGVEKSKKLILEADLVLLVLNNNEKITKEEQEIIDEICDKNHIIIINKIDLDNKLNITDLNDPILVSIKDNIGLNEIKERIRKMFSLEKIRTGDFTYLTNARGIALLKRAEKSIEDVIKGIDKQVPIDMIEIDIKEIWNLLGELIGRAYEEELIDQLFSQFCLGK